MLALRKFAILVLKVLTVENKDKAMDTMHKRSESVHINESDEDSGDDDWRGIRHQDSQSIKEIEISRYTKISDETDVLRSPAIDGTPQEFYQSLSPPVIKTEPITEELDIDHYIYREGSSALDDEDEHSADSIFYNAETLTLPKISETPEKLNSMETFYHIKEEEIMEDIKDILPLFIDQRRDESENSPRPSESEFVIKTEPIDELLRDDDSCYEPTYRSMSPIQSPLAGDNDNFQEALDDDLREILPLFVDKRKDSDDELQEIVNEVENSLDEKLRFRTTFSDDFVLEEDEKIFANSSSSSDRLTSDEEYVFSSLVKAVDFPVLEDSSEDEVSEYETSSEAEGDFSDENMTEEILRGNDGLKNFILQNPKDKERIMIGKVTQSTVESSETPGDDYPGDFSLEDENEIPEETNGSSDGKNFMKAISSVEIDEGSIFPQNSSTVSEMSIISDYQATADETSTDLNNSPLQMVVDSEAGEIADPKEIQSYVSDEVVDIFGENGGNGDILESTGDILENDVQIPNNIPSAKGNEQELNSENIVKLTENLSSANISPGIEKDLRSGFSTTTPLSTEENIAQLIETLRSPEIESSESNTLKIDKQTGIIHHDDEKEESAEKIHISEEILQDNVVSAEEEKVIPGEAIGSSEALQISQRDVSAETAEEKIPEKMTESTSMDVPQLVSTEISPTKKEENNSENREFPNEIDYTRIPITEKTEIPQEITSMPLIVDENVDLDEVAVAKSHSLDVPSEEPTERVPSSENTSESTEIHILNENCGDVPSEAPQEEINTEKTDEIEFSEIAAVSDDIIPNFVMTNEKDRNFGDINTENTPQKGSDDNNESDSLTEMSSMEIHEGISRATDEIEILQDKQLNIPSIEGNSDEDDAIILQSAKVLSNLSEFPSEETNLHDSEGNDEKSSEIHEAAGASPVITEIISPAPESPLRTFSIENIDEHMENEEIGHILMENDEQKEELPNVDAVDEQSATDEDECSELKASEPVLTSSTARCEEENREESQVGGVESFGIILQAPQSPSILSECAGNEVDVEDLNIGRTSTENVEIILEKEENEKNGRNLNHEGNEENENHEENMENEKEGEDEKKEGNERILVEYEDMTEASPHFAISATELTLTPSPTIDDNQVLAESATNGDVSSESGTEVPKSISTSSLVNNGDDDDKHVENEYTSTISEFSSMTLPVSSDDEETVENLEKSPFPGTDENSVEIAEIGENYEITSCDNDKNVESSESAGNDESSSTISESSSMTSCVSTDDAPIEPPADLNDSPIESSAKLTDSSMESPEKLNDSPIKSPAKHNDSSTKSPTRRDDYPIENSIAETPVSQKRKPSRRINSSDEENDSRSQLTSTQKKRRKLFIRSDSVQELYTMPDEKTSQATLQSSVAAPKRIREKRQLLFNSDTQDVLKQVLHKFKVAEQGNVIESSGEILNSAVQPTESSRVPLSEVFIQNAGGSKISPEIDDHASQKSAEIQSQPLTQEILPETHTQASNWTPNLPPPVELEAPDGIDNEVEIITEKISVSREEDEICQRILTPPPLFRESQTNDNADNEKLGLSDDIQLRNELRDETLSPPSSRQSSVCVEDDADDNIVELPQENSRKSLMCAPKVVQQGGKVVLVPRDQNSTSPRGNSENSHRPEVGLKNSIINDEPLRSNEIIFPGEEEAETSQNNEISMKENETPAENINEDKDKNTPPTDDLELSPDESEENVVSASERDNEESENIFRTPIRKPKFLNQFLNDELSKQNEQLNSDDESIAGCSTRPPSSRMSEDSDYQSLDGQSLDGKSQHVYAPKVVKLKGVKRKRTSAKIDEEDEEMIAEEEEVEDEVPSTQPESSRNSRIGKRSKGHVRATYKVVKTLVDDLAKCPTAENEVPDPDGFMAGIKLHPHQKHALIWMQWREGCTPPGGILADDMGLGKTIETIALILASLKEDERVKDCKMGESSRTTPGGTLIVCPANVVIQWQDEFMLKVKKRALSIFKFHYDQKEHRKSVLADFDVVITSYETLNKNLKDRGVFSKIHWRRVILDEGHKIKNDKTEISKCVTKLDSDKRWVLTGTPVHNGKRDLYAIFRFLKLESFEISNIFNTWIDNDNHWGITRLNKILSAIMLRRTKQDYQAKNPDSKLFSKKYIVIHKIELSADERQAYDCVMKQTKQQLLVKLNNQQVPAKVLASSGIVTTNHVLTMIMRLRQMCVHPCLIWKQVAGEMAQEIQATKLKLREALDCINKTDEQIKIDHPIFDEDNLSTKLKAVLQKIQEITENEDKVIVVSEFVQVLNLIALHLKKRPNGKDDYEFYTGITKPAERARVVRKFNDVCSTKILLLSLKAGGQGLNLMAANHVIIVDVHWNPQLENQAHDRVHRIGQTKDVYIHKFLCNDSIEERIVALQQIKMDIADAALAGTAGSNRFCDDELRFLFDVRK